jgi:hypothetical protein
VSRRIEKFFCAKRAAAIRTRVADTGFVWVQNSGQESSTQPPNGGERTDNQAFSVLGVRLTRTGTMGKLSSHTHECPRCAGCTGNVARKLSGRVPVSLKDVVYEVLGSRTGKGCVFTKRERTGM